MVIDELLLGGRIHAIEWIECSGEITVEVAAGRDDLVHDFVTLLVGDAGSERNIGQVSADTNTSGLDHSGTHLIERRALE